MISTLAVLAVGILLLIYALFFSREKQVMEDTPTSKVRSVAMGFAELKGTAKPSIMLVSPYSNLPCIYYKYKVEVVEENGRRRSRRTIKEGESGAAFYLEDETGKILVYPKRAEIRLSRSLNSADPPEISTEWTIMAGDQLYVAGTVGKMKDFTGVEFDQHTHYRQELERNKGLLSDIDLKPGEWAGPQAQEEARQRIREEIKQLELKINSFDHAAHDNLAEEIAVGKGGGEETFLISDMSEEDLAQQMSYSNALVGAAGAGMVLYALWTFMQG